MLSNTSKYALRAIIYLTIHASADKKVGIKKISEDLTIPTPFLGKILQSLAKQKLLLSTKGPNGGFALAKDPALVSLYDIVTIIDGEDIFSNCLISMRSCGEAHQYCPVHANYEAIRKDMKGFFQNETLASIAQKMDKSPENIII
jgi:Rrf2 family iron-sulfur cluster assembly transcriptional regulator